MQYYQHSKSDFHSHKIHLFNGFKSLPCVYLVAVEGTNIVKIGRTTSDIQYRISSLQCGCPYKLNLLIAAKTPLPNKIEDFLHKKYKHKNHRGEWFNFSDDDISELIEFLILTNENVKGVFETLQKWGSK